MSDKFSLENKKEEKFLKAFKCRIYPTEAQKILIEKSFGCLRLAYNEHLQERTEFYAENILPVKNTTTKEEKSEIYKTVKASLASELKIKYPFMNEVSDWVVQNGIRQCEVAYKNFFNNLKKKRKVGKKKNPYGFPQYKSKKDSHQSFSMQNVDFKKHFDRNSSTVKVPKLGKIKFYKPVFPEWFKIVESFGTVTISRTSSGRYYISILCHLKHEFKFRGKLERKEKLGLDFSPKLLYVDSELLSV